MKSHNRPNVVVKPVTSDGWKTVNGKKFYYSKGKTVTGQQHISSEVVPVRSRRCDEDQAPVFGQSAQDLLLCIKWSDAMRPAAHQQQSSTCSAQTVISRRPGFNGYQIAQDLLLQRQWWIPVRSQQHIGGKWYLFDRTPWCDEDRVSMDIRSAQDLLLQRIGQMQYSQQHRRQVVFVRQEHRRDEDRVQWISDRRKTCYYSSNGQMQCSQHIGGKWYLFARTLVR